MAARRRQVQTSENQNGKHVSGKGSAKSKHHAKPRTRDDEFARPKEMSTFYKICLISAAVIIGLVHKSHIANMFESDRHFSHLSTLEREMTFRTEMGLYYSYYKTMITSKTFGDGLHQIMNDNVTEFPDTINTLKRFNLYPEVVLGMAFRCYEGVNAMLKRSTKICWTVNRGDGLSPVQSCEGLGEPSYFYIEAVFSLNGMMMSIFFLFGTYLSGSVLGGVLTVASFLYNHGENILLSHVAATRVQWTPPLRESFAYPFLVIHMFLVTHLLRCDKPSLKYSVFIAIATISFMLPWQFAQFALLTETYAVFATYMLAYIGSHKMKVFLLGQISGFLISCVLLFGNTMLLTSFFATSLGTITVIILLEPVLEKVRIRALIMILQGFMLLVGTVGFKFIVSKFLHIEDDAHIGDIFRSKFSDFNNFHTMLYTCAKEFNFMEPETPWLLSKTLLAPCVLMVVAVVTYYLLRWEYFSWTEADNSDEDNEQIKVGGPHRSKPNAEIVYHLFQLAAFTLMAVIIMRLKLFWTPHLCLMTALLASRQFFGWLGTRERQYAVVAVILAAMSIGGIANLQHQWSIVGEFSNVQQEELIEWINTRTPPNAVFAGPMPTMATVKLCTGRPIVNHPHYEDAGLRERTKKVYMMYSRKPVQEVNKNLKDLRVDYTILEDSWCTRRTRAGCSMPEIWDLEDEANRGEPTPACTKVRSNPAPYFKRVFQNSVYQVLKVL